VVLQMASGKELEQGAPGAEGTDATKGKPAAGEAAPKTTAKPKSPESKKSSAKPAGKTAADAVAAKKRQQELKKRAETKKAAQKANRRKTIVQPATAASRSRHPAARAQGG